MEKELIEITFPRLDDVEEAFMSVCINYPQLARKYVPAMNEDMFNNDVCKSVFVCIRERIDKNEDYDYILLVSDLMKKFPDTDHGKWGYSVSVLMKKVFNTEHMHDYFRLIVENYIRKKSVLKSYEIFRSSYEISSDPFSIIEMYGDSVNELNRIMSLIVKEEKNIPDQMIEFLTNPEHKDKYDVVRCGIGCIDDIVSFLPGRLLLIAGAAKSGKTKLASYIVWNILENSKNVSVLWITLEDSAKDIIAAYCSYKTKIKTKDIIRRNITEKDLKRVVEHVNTWKKYDVVLYDKSVSVNDIRKLAISFVNNRPDRFNLLVIDNLLSLEDKYQFRNNINQFYDHVIGKISDIKRDTGCFVILLHHLKDDVSDDDNIEIAYRPDRSDIKGTEASRRVPNYVFLINTPFIYKKLLAQYKDERRYTLERMMIIDPTDIRDERVVGDESLIRMYCNLDFNFFKEL